MSKTRFTALGLAALLLCCTLACCAASAEVVVSVRPAQTAAQAVSAPVIPEDADAPDVIGAFLKDARVIYASDVNDYATDILAEGCYTRFTNRKGLELGLGRLLNFYGDRRDEWINNQCIVVRFRIHNDNGICFQLNGDSDKTLLFSLLQPDYPSFGLSTEPLAGYRYFGLDYPTAFTFVPGQWFFALLAVTPDARLRLAVWQESDPGNMAYDQADLANDGRFPTGPEYLNREWHLSAWVYDTDAVDMDVAGYYIVEYSDLIW